MSDAFPKVFKFSSEVSECEPLPRGSQRADGFKHRRQHTLLGRAARGADNDHLNAVRKNALVKKLHRALSQLQSPLRHHAGGSLSTSTPTDIGQNRTTHLQCVCSYKHAKEEEEEEEEEGEEEEEMEEEETEEDETDEEEGRIYNVGGVLVLNDFPAISANFSSLAATTFWTHSPRRRCSSSRMSGSVDAAPASAAARDAGDASSMFCVVLNRGGAGIICLAVCPTAALSDPMAPLPPSLPPLAAVPAVAAPLAASLAAPLAEAYTRSLFGSS